MPCEVRKERSLAEEDRGIVWVGGVTKLYAKETAICRLFDVSGVNMTFRKESEAEPDSGRLEVFSGYI